MVSPPDRLAGAISDHSKLVLAVMLVVVVAVGSGAVAVEDDSSLEQFESDSPEANAQEYIQSNFTTDEDGATVQLITRGENVLSKESLLASLRFQQEIRDDEGINETLAEEDGLVGVENIVATVSIIEDRADELEAEADELEAEADDLEAERERLETDQELLEADAERLEERGDELERRGERLEADSAALEERRAILEEGLDEAGQLYLEAEMTDNETAREAGRETIEAAAAAANLTESHNETYFEAAELSSANAFLETISTNQSQEDTLRSGLEDVLELQVELEAADTDEENESIEEEIDDTVENTTEEAGLDAQNSTIYAAFVDDFRQEADGLTEVPTNEEIAYGVFETEFRELEMRGDELEADRQRLERDADRLQERGDELAERGDELETRGEELEAWGDEIENRSDELEELEPTLTEQIEHLESLNQTELENALESALSENEDASSQALGLMPTDYEPGSTTAESRMLVVTQVANSSDEEIEGVPVDLIETQLELRELAHAYSDDLEDDYMVFGAGIIFEEIDQSMGDSLAIVGPVALLFVVLALSIAYRDVLDIALGVGGIIAVLLMTFGFMGWTGTAFNQMMVAVPVLLIGLSIDYAIHVFMRHREQRQNGAVADSIGGSMSVALAGVGVALVWVTATTAIGFLANVTSPIGPIQEFGIVSTFGILSALLVFGLLVPAAKIELDRVLERFGFDRRKRAFGTGGGRLGRFLTSGARAAQRAPLAVILVVALLTAGGLVGASQVDTSFEEEDFLAESPPEWTQHLGPLAPGEYSAKEDLAFVNEHFQRADAEVSILVQGNVTDPELLQQLNRTTADLADSETAFILPTGEADARGPLEAMEQAAAQNESFNESFQAADTTGDGIPDENVSALYDELLAVDERAAEVIYRTDEGSYESVRLVVAIDGDAGFDEVTAEMRGFAVDIEAGADVSATATGTPIVNHVVEQHLMGTVLESLMLSLIAVFVFLTAAYWLTGKGAVLGAVTLLPVALTVSWILGTMYLLGMPFNVMTGMITSLTIGLGVAYSIHISSRYTLELDRTGNVWTAMERTVTGTGGALLGSAATTIGGFGTLALAIFPALQQFGIITGLTIFYAFLASVLVLPTFLVVWTRFQGPGNVSFAVPSDLGRETVADGGETAGDES